MNRDEEEAIALAEGLPEKPLPNEGLPKLTTLEAEKEPPKGRGLEKALKILDEYEEDVPPRNPHVQNYEE